MTLRDIGSWFTEKWDAASEGLQIAATQSFWDWPLWLSIPVGIGIPSIVLWFIANHIRETQGQRASFWGSFGFSVGALLCAFVTYDIWFGHSIFHENQRSIRLLQIGYPIMTFIFGFAGLAGFASRRRGATERNSQE